MFTKMTPEEALRTLTPDEYFEYNKMLDSMRQAEAVRNTTEYKRWIRRADKEAARREEVARLMKFKNDVANGKVA